jgi:hypothetical protein
MELLPEALRAQIPPLSTTKEKDPMVWARLANSVSGWRWYFIQMEQIHTDAFCYGYMVGWDEGLTYFTLSDLDQHAAEVGQPNELDATFTPCRLSAVQASERGSHGKFPSAE